MFSRAQVAYLDALEELAVVGAGNVAGLVILGQTNVDDDGASL